MDPSRCWSWTLNFPVELPLDQCVQQGEDLMHRFAERDSVKYSVYQIERAPTTDRLHYQGYIVFNRPVRLPTVKRLLGRTVHAEHSRGSLQQNRDYCTKEESRVFGPWEVLTNSQTDIVELRYRRSVIAL